MRLRSSGMLFSPIGSCMDIRRSGENINRQSFAADNRPTAVTSDVTLPHNPSSAVSSLNNNDGGAAVQLNSRHRTQSESTSLSSWTDSLGHDQGQSSSSVDIFPQGDEYHCFSEDDTSDSDFSDNGNSGLGDRNELTTGGINNPNYSIEYGSDSDANGNATDLINHLDSDQFFEKHFYDKPKFEASSEIVKKYNIVDEDYVNSECRVDILPQVNFVISSTDHKFEFSPLETYLDSGVCSSTEPDTDDTFLVQIAHFPVSGVYETTLLPEDDSDASPSPSVESKALIPSNPVQESPEFSEENRVTSSSVCLEHKLIPCGTKKENPVSPEGNTVALSFPLDEKKMICNTVQENPVKMSADVYDMHSKSAKDSANEKMVVEAVKQKKDELFVRRIGADDLLNSKKTSHRADPILRRSATAKSRLYGGRRTSPLDKKSIGDLGAFDVYNIETAMPSFDLEAIENHLKAAKAEEQRRRDDRDEIRRRLAMGPDIDEAYVEKSGRKPSLHSRLQGGMNLQICFMNDPVSDSESPSTDAEGPDSLPPVPEVKRSGPFNPKEESYCGPRPSTAKLTLPLNKELNVKTASDLVALQARLQSEARQALMQAKEMARMQMQVEKQRMPLSPITQMVRASLLKVGVPFPEERRRLSRQLLTEMNIAQLQVIINDLHSQIEILNENLVEFLMMRDDLHMEQDSMLVDVEDLTRFIEAKEKSSDSHLSGNRNSGADLGLYNTSSC